MTLQTKANDCIAVDNGQSDGPHELRLTAGILEYANLGNQASLMLTTPLGTVYLRKTHSGGRRWDLKFSSPRLASADHVLVAMHFTESHLRLLTEAADLIPRDLVEATLLSSRCEAELDLLRLLLPGIFSVPLSIQDMLGDLLARLAYEIYYALNREEKRRAYQEEKTADDRIRAQFCELPAGTVLVDREGMPMIAIVSDRPGTRTRRSLDVTMGDGGTFGCDMNRNARDGLCLLTPARAQALGPRLLSSHQISAALLANKGLEKRFPLLA